MLDRRLNAFRADLAEIGLKGRVNAARFVVGEKARVVVAVAELRSEPHFNVGVDTQLLFGESVTVFEMKNGWSWVKSDIDSYVGYLPDRFLDDAGDNPTHWITAPRTFIYPEPELKTAPVGGLSMGSRISVIEELEHRGTRYLVLEDERAVVAGHCRPLGEVETEDYVSIAGRFLETPYLWGGRSGFGIDCSGLVQLALHMTGVEAPRDSDMQAAGLGVEIAPDEIRRGDLVFWKGHVGILEDSETLLHANGHTMSVSREPLRDAIVRISYLYGEPTGFRRPQ
ncbi:NlpC/P60 family protein [Rhizobium sp. L1K21]|uniref:C40 family peptidase n=1 Tax=Rhizobium sp. L1K21 TaxID=2954933 RepID=UPI0020930CAC|nr:NlpC/P60 family protein [Rhizobium sp. L1K21]MCO6187257.1 NlpC/P60 family protein [Rhizobium sp. L1K21]